MTSGRDNNTAPYFETKDNPHNVALEFNQHDLSNAGKRAAVGSFGDQLDQGKLAKAADKAQSKKKLSFLNLPKNPFPNWRNWSLPSIPSPSWSLPSFLSRSKKEAPVLPAGKESKYHSVVPGQDSKENKSVESNKAAPSASFVASWGSAFSRMGSSIKSAFYSASETFKKHFKGADIFASGANLYGSVSKKEKKQFDAESQKDKEKYEARMADLDNPKSDQSIKIKEIQARMKEEAKQKQSEQPKEPRQESKNADQAQQAVVSSAEQGKTLSSQAVIDTAHIDLQIKGPADRERESKHILRDVKTAGNEPSPIPNNEASQSNKSRAGVIALNQDKKLVVQKGDNSDRDEKEQGTSSMDTRASKKIMESSFGQAFGNRITQPISEDEDTDKDSSVDKPTTNRPP